jgi:DNA-binding PadR family transcriptional regulator
MKQSTFSSPLSTAVTYILLALAEEDLHGYGIMQGTMRLSGGDYKMGPGTLYDNLKTLIAAGLVDEFEADDGAGGVRRLYHLNKMGAEVLADELKRLEQVVKAGRKRLASSQATSGQTRKA